MISKKVNFKWLLLSFIGIMLIILGILLYSRKSQAEAKKSSYQPITVDSLTQDTVTGANFLLSGIVKPNNLKNIMLDPKKGKVMETLVQEGDQVTAGQELFRYVSPENEFEVRQAQLEVENAEKMVMQKQEEANFKWGRYNERNTELENAKNKLANGSEGEKSMLQEEKNAKEDALGQSLEAARLADSEIKNTQLELDKAKLDLEAIQQKYGENTVYSEINGRMAKIEQDQLNNNTPDDKKPFMQIVDDSSYYVEGTVDEFRKNQLQLDQQVQAIDRAQDGKTWNGKITRIDQLASTEDSEQKEDENPNLSKYPYRAVLDQTSEMPEIDKNVYLSVQPLESSEDIYLPAEYLVKENDKWFVWLVKKNKLKKSDVHAEENQELGAAKITKGLSRQDRLILPEKGLKDGMDVQ